MTQCLVVIRTPHKILTNVLAESCKMNIIANDITYQQRKEKKRKKKNKSKLSNNKKEVKKKKNIRKSFKIREKICINNSIHTKLEYI